MKRLSGVKAKADFLFDLWGGEDIEREGEPPRRNAAVLGGKQETPKKMRLSEKEKDERDNRPRKG
jgi:hypothetical protein